MDLQYVSDRLAIEDLFTAYAASVDGKDWARWRTLFTDDAHVDYTSAGGIAGTRDEVAAWLEETLAWFPATQHLVSNIDSRIEGDTATVRAMFFNPMKQPDGKVWFTGGWYNHDLVRVDDGWKSRRLVEESTWFYGME